MTEKNSFIVWHSVQGVHVCKVNSSCENLRNWLHNDYLKRFCAVSVNIKISTVCLKDQILVNIPKLVVLYIEGLKIQVFAI